MASPQPCAYCGCLIPPGASKCPGCGAAPLINDAECATSDVEAASRALSDAMLQYAAALPSGGPDSDPPLRPSGAFPVGWYAAALLSGVLAVICLLGLTASPPRALFIALAAAAAVSGIVCGFAARRLSGR